MKTSIIRFSNIIIFFIIGVIFNSCASKEAPYLHQNHTTQAPNISGDTEESSRASQEGLYPQNDLSAPLFVSSEHASAAAAADPMLDFTVTMRQLSDNAFNETLAIRTSEFPALTFGCLLAKLSIEIQGINLSTLQYGNIYHPWENDKKTWSSDASIANNISFEFVLADQVLCYEARINNTSNKEIEITVVTSPAENLVSFLKQQHPGSANHPFGCRPCHFVQGGLCSKQLNCNFCHLCPKPKRLPQRLRHLTTIERLRHLTAIEGPMMNSAEEDMKRPIDEEDNRALMELAAAEQEEEGYAQPAASSSGATSSAAAIPVLDNEAADREQARIQAIYEEFLREQAGND